MNLIVSLGREHPARVLKTASLSWQEYVDQLLVNQIYVKRTANVGVIPEALAVAYGLTGPCLRGSGVAYDIRRIEPYAVYDKLDFKVCSGTGAKGTVGDSWDRYWVKMVRPGPGDPRRRPARAASGRRP